MTSSTSSAGLVLVAYAETLCRGARALVVGDARTPLAAALIERGTRLVHVCDRDQLRRAEAAARNTDRNVSFGALDDGPAALREAFFDLVIVENLAGEADARAALAAVGRLLAPRGAVFVATPNPDVDAALIPHSSAPRGIDYYALYDAVAHAFPHVRMLGQVPFVGYAMVDFGAEGEPSAVLDASLLPPRGEEPDYFVALAGLEPRSLDEYAVIQLPSSSVRPAAGGAAEQPPAPIAALAVSAPEPQPVTGPSAQVRELESRLQAQDVWIGELELRATTADERADAAEAELDELRERLASGVQSSEHERRTSLEERAALRTEVEALRRAQNDLSDLLTLKDADLKALAADLARKQNDLETIAAAAARKQSDLEALTVSSARKETELKQLAEQAAAQESELRALVQDADVTAELARLEAQLSDRGQEIRRLEQKLREAERVGRELVRKLREQSGLIPSTGLSTRLAEAEAELVTLRWSLQIAGTSGAAGALG